MSTRVRKERGGAIVDGAFFLLRCLLTSLLVWLAWLMDVNAHIGTSELHLLTGLFGMADGCQHSHWYFYILDTPMVLYWFSEGFFTLLSLLSLLEFSSLLFGSSLGT